MGDSITFGQSFRRFGVVIVGGALFGCLAALASPIHHILIGATVTSTPPTLKAPGSGLLNIRLTIAPGYHIYAQNQKQPYLIPTVVTLNKSTGVTFGSAAYPRPETVVLPAGQGRTRVYTGQVVVHVPFTVDHSIKAGALLLSGQVRYQACNDAACYPPAKLSFTSTLTVK